MKVDQGQVTAAIATVRAGARSEDGAAAAEALRRARMAAPDCVAFLHNVVRAERIASPMQRVRAACTLLQVGGFVPADNRSSGVFAEPEGADGGGDDAPAAS